MGLSRLAEQCRKCPFKDNCKNKRIEALGYLPMGLNGESGECIDILKNISSRGMISISITLPKSLEMWLGILR